MATLLGCRGAAPRFGLLLGSWAVDCCLRWRFAGRPCITRSAAWHKYRVTTWKQYASMPFTSSPAPSKANLLSFQRTAPNWTQWNKLRAWEAEECFRIAAFGSIRYTTMLQQAEVIDSRELGQQAEVELEMLGTNVWLIDMPRASKRYILYTAKLVLATTCFQLEEGWICVLFKERPFQLWRCLPESLWQGMTVALGRVLEGGFMVLSAPSLSVHRYPLLCLAQLLFGKLSYRSLDGFKKNPQFHHWRSCKTRINGARYYQRRVGSSHGDHRHSQFSRLWSWRWGFWDTGSSGGWHERNSWDSSEAKEWPQKAAKNGRSLERDAARGAAVCETMGEETLPRPAAALRILTHNSWDVRTCENNAILRHYISCPKSTQVSCHAKQTPPNASYQSKAFTGSKALDKIRRSGLGA